MEDLFNFQMDALPELSASDFHLDDQDHDHDNDQMFEEFLQNGKKAFKCIFNNCGKVFKYKSDITRHGLIHSNSRPYYCPYEGCKKSFKRPDVLDGHIRTHTRQLPFECEEPGCNAKFTSNAGLKYHLLKHKGQKPFVCNYEGCGRSFMTMAQLKQHESTLKYHKNTVAPTPARPEEEIVQKVAVVEAKEKKDDIEYFMPKPRAAKTLMWEIKNPDELDEPEKVPEPEQKQTHYDLDQIMSFFMEENKALKKQLEECNKKTGYSPEPISSYSFDTELKTGVFNLDSPQSPSLYELHGFKSPIPEIELGLKSMVSHYDDNSLNLFDFMKDGGCSPL